MSDFDDYDDGEQYIAEDFYSIVGSAQRNELEKVEKERAQQRQAQLDAMKENNDLTLLQAIGLKTQKDIEVLTQDRTVREEKRSEEDEQKRKEAERVRLEAKYPPPDLD